jgi:thiol-disulfide isomerase/thioredoxin
VKFETFGSRFLTFGVALICLTSCGQNISKRLTTTAPSKTSEDAFLEVNSDEPGKEINVKSSIVFGKYTIIDFSSEGCPSCRELKPLLERLAAARPDIVVRSFNVNRKGVDGIDWESPLVAEYRIRSLPYLQIFNEKGVLIAEGSSAKQQVIGAINNDLFARHH